MRIQYKLFIAILASGICLIASMYLLMQWSLTQGLIEFANNKERQALSPFIQTLEAEYTSKNSWASFENNPVTFHELFLHHSAQNDTLNDALNHLIKGRKTPQKTSRPPLNSDKLHTRPEKPNKHKPRHPPERHHKIRGNPPRAHFRPPPRKISLALLNNKEQFIAGNPKLPQDRNQLPLNANGQTIGYLIMPKRDQLIEGFELNLLNQQRSSYLLISLLLLSLTALFALPLAIHLISPIKKITTRVSKLTQGDYKQTLSIHQSDELGSLARDINELATTLDNNQHARKRWFADISHELRTPVAILQGELEAIMDGVRALDMKQIESLNQELQRLKRLIDDLYELSATDIGALKYRKETLQLNEFLLDERVTFETLFAEHTLTFQLQITDTHLSIHADVDRLSQLLNNILSNAIKYATSGTHVTLKLEQQKNNAVIHIIDDGPGVPSHDLEFLFDHLYRVDDARNSQTGGSGLGLAICKKIVEAHQGTIQAHHAQPHGLMISISIPLTPPQ